MFSLHDFIMSTVCGMIGRYPDFQVQEYALNWYVKNIFTTEDLASIEGLIDAQYLTPESEPEHPVEE